MKNHSLMMLTMWTISLVLSVLVEILFRKYLSLSNVGIITAILLSVLIKEDLEEGRKSWEKEVKK